MCVTGDRVSERSKWIVTVDKGASSQRCFTITWKPVKREACLLWKMPDSSIWFFILTEVFSKQNHRITENTSSNTEIIRTIMFLLVFLCENDHGCSSSSWNWLFQVVCSAWQSLPTGSNIFKNSCSVTADGVCRKCQCSVSQSSCEEFSTNKLYSQLYADTHFTNRKRLSRWLGIFENVDASKFPKLFLEVDCFWLNLTGRVLSP